LIRSCIGNMLCHFDMTKGYVIVAHILHGIGVTKKDTSVSIINHVSRMMLRGQSIDTASKGVQ